MTDQHDVLIYCTHGGGHHAVATLVMARYASRPEWGWTLALVGDAHGDFTALTAELVDDRALSTFATPEVAGELSDRRRERYRFECEDCGDTVPARKDRLAACGAILAGHGESEASMTTLRRMLALI